MNAGALHKSVKQNKKDGSPTERASVSAISLRHNLATSVESRRYVVAFTRFAGYLATSRECKAHFGLPWVCFWDNRGKYYIDGKKIQ